LGALALLSAAAPAQDAVGAIIDQCLGGNTSREKLTF
jgi:hypothetical protein